MIIDSASYTCAGGHDINEDSLLCRAEKGIFVVADGLGGHSDGEKASQAAISYFEENTDGGYTGEKLSALLEGANAEVLKNGDGGKTTVASAFMENGDFIYANVGDSRVYYFRGGKIIAQTKDHSVCQASVDMGMIRPEDIRGNEDRSRLLKVLGGDETLNIKKSYPPIKIQSGDAFLICSDGFWEYVYETEMEADLLKSDSADVWLRHMLKRHILRAENKGDNYTAVCGIIHLDGSEDFAQTAAVPEKPQSIVSVMNKKNIIIISAAVAVIAAAAVFLFLFFGGKNSNGSPEGNDTETGAVSSAQTATDEAENLPETGGSDSFLTEENSSSSFTENISRPDAVGSTTPKQSATASPEPVENTATEPVENTAPEPTETTPPTPAETTPPKPAETTPPKPAETTPPKPAETTPPKPAETTPPKPAETTIPEPVENTAPEVSENSAPETAELTAPVLEENSSPETAEVSLPHITEEIPED